MDESEIPIDIHTNKLMDWLVSRRHVPRDWQTRVYAVREKINEAIKDMPVHDGIAALLSGSYINYYHCQKIVKILEETESGSKNLFGQYGSQRMIDWREVNRLYEKDNVYLGEVASLLLRNVNYEVPALRKMAQKAVQVQEEYDKKEADYNKQANNMKNEINASFKELGIQGKNVRVELLKKATELPKMNEKLANDAKSLEKGVEFYSSVVAALSAESREVLKTLKLVMDKGDITVFEWRTGRVPKVVENLEINLESAEETAADDEGIDFGVDLEIDAGDDIDWGISTEEPAASGDKTAKVDKDTATGSDARTILGNPDSRTQFMNDVLELEAFLKLRQHDLKAGDSLSFTALPDVLTSVDEKTLAAMLEPVQRVLSGLNNPTALHCLNIVTNPSYVETLIKKLNQKQQTVEKLLASKEFVKVQRAEAAKEALKIDPKIKLLIEKTKELQDQIEVDISKRYKGRPVNLMGGANAL